jgi:PAS domain S-box-containing protein
VTVFILSIFSAESLGKVKELWFENIKRVELSEAKYRLIAENASDMIWALDLGTMRFTYMSPSVKKMRGYMPEEAMKLPLEKTLSPDSYERVLKILQEELNNEGKEGVDPERSRTIEMQSVRKDGTYMWIEATMNFIRDKEGRPVGVLGVTRDIGERKRAEEEKLVFATQLQQAHKMESIGTLAGGIAHDFNNLLSPIMAYSEMAMMELPQNSPIQQNLRHIYKAGERARDLVKQILAFARRREEDRIPLKTSMVVEEAIKFLRSIIPSTIQIKYDCLTEQDTVLADPTQMNQIVMNLCSNATHAMREKGGILEIILNNEHIGPDDITQFSGLTSGHYLRLLVRDTGPGIPPDIIEKIFEPYFTTKGPGEGTGMGLALIYGIVKSYGGDVGVESEVGKGTTFHVLLPFEEAEVSLTTETKIELPRGKERILLVDDDKDIVDIIQSMLKNLGYKVTARTSSIEALEAFRHNPEAFDIVITDMTMPNMTGKDLAKELMAMRSDIPIILCTGFSELIDERRAKEMGISAFVMKPIVMRQIANTIREVLVGKNALANSKCIIDYFFLHSPTHFQIPFVTLKIP